jgi:hypothetical protein
LKGMQKIKRGKIFLGVLSYSLAGGPVIGGNVVGMTPSELAKEFRQARKIREDIKKPVWHNSLRLKKGERISPEKFVEIADDYMLRMGFSELHQRVYIMHDHPDGQHIHIVANRISMLGKIYYGQNENLKSTKIIASLEREHGLTISPDNIPEKKNDHNRKFYNHIPKPHPGSFGRTAKNGMRKLSECHLVHSRPGGQEERANTDLLSADVRHHRFPIEKLRWTKPARRRPTAGEVGMAERTGEVPTRMQLQAIIDQACAGSPDFAEFVGRLQEAGVSTIPSGKSGAPQGVSFSLNGQPYKGSDLGKLYAFKGLKSRVDYDPERDQHIIDSLRVQAEKENEEEKGELSPLVVPHSVPEPYKGSPRTLELALEKDGNLYKWRGRGTRVALIDKGQSISVMSKADSAIRASLQLSKDKVWLSVNATGSEEFRRKSWLIGSEMGLLVEGYDPTPEDQEQLKNILAQKKEVARNDRKNRANDGSVRNRSSEQDQDSCRTGGTGRAPGAGSDQPDRGDTGQPAREPGSSGGHTGSGRTPDEIQTTTANTDNPRRSTDLADPAFIADCRIDIRSVGVRVDNVEGLAAPAPENRDIKPTSSEGRPDTVRPITKDHAEKIAAWRAQHAALGAPAYRVTLVDRDPDRIAKHGRMGLGYVIGKKTGHDIKTPGEVEAAISTLRRENARKFDIYITPIDDKNHYLLIDDIHEEKAGKLRKFKADDFTPALIQFSSNDNFQAILKVPKIDGDHDFANQIFQKLNTDYGEAGIKGGVVHPFRMCGYANKKAGKSGFTRLIETNPGATCEKTSELIKFAMANHDAERQAKEVEKEKSRRLKAIENHNQMPLNQGGNDAVLRAYQKSFNRMLGLAKKQGWNIDLSRIDFAVTKDLIKQNYRAELIERAIAAGSPNIEQRKGQHIDDYARLTVQKAMVSSDVIQHKARAEAKQAQRSGPRL